MNALNGVGLLYGERNQLLFFLGTCFAFRHRNYFLTAAHCVADRSLSNLHVLQPSDGILTPIRSVKSHQEADIAIVTLSNGGKETTEPFWDFVGNYSLGEEFMAYGFPEDSRGPNEGVPTPRVFRGYYQRFVQHKSHMGYSYMAGELNIACPGGLSGGPLFRPGAHPMVTSIVTENFEVATQLDSEEKVIADGKQVQEYYRRVINYGVAVMLHPLKDWLNENIPPRNT